MGLSIPGGGYLRDNRAQKLIKALEVDKRKMLYVPNQAINDLYISLGVDGSRIEIAKAGSTPRLAYVR